MGLGAVRPDQPRRDRLRKTPSRRDREGALINNANAYAFSGLSHDFARVHQGWGTPDLVRTYDRANAGKSIVVDETVVLAPLGSASWNVNVAAGEPDLRATLAWSDPPGTTSATVHRINDLDLKVTSPSGVVYWGNHGLLTGNWSTPGGPPNSIDTVENVFVQNPQAGGWNVTVYAIQINQDGHVETPALDADFALVLTGAAASVPGSPDTGQANSAAASLFVNAGTNLNGEGAFPGIPGPFFTSGSIGGPLTFMFSGPPSSGVILAMGALNRNNVVFPGVGSLDIGLLGLNLSDVMVLLDGVSGSSFLDQLANTGPLGSATLGFTIPPFPLGIAGTFQAAVVAPRPASGAHGGLPAHDQLIA